MLKHLLDITDFSAAELAWFVAFAHGRKQLLLQDGPAALGQPMRDKSLALLFQKPSLRTRVSFERACQQLGGLPLYLSPAEVDMGNREDPQDVARVLGRYCHGIMARVFRHEDVVTLARESGVPVINGLSDLTHPCQTLADVLTMAEAWSGEEFSIERMRGRRVAFIGDGNNVARPLARASAMLGMSFVLVCPKQYAFEPGFVDELKQSYTDFAFAISHEPLDGVAGADCLYTDTWVSMHQKDEQQKRLDDFAGFTIDEASIAATGRKPLIMHCLPAYRGCEISDAAMEHANSVVFDQAENRLHAQRAVLELMFGQHGLP